MMKKILILLVTAYISIVVFQVYRNVEYHKNKTDKKWQYFKQVISASDDIDKEEKCFVSGWDGEIKVKIEGAPTDEDLKTLKATINQLNDLIAPKRISLIYSKTIAPNVNIYFLNKSDINEHNWPRNTFSKCLFLINLPTINHSDNETTIVRYKISNFKQYIRTDSTTQIQRNSYIVKGMTNMLIGLPDIKDEFEHTYENFESTIYFDAFGRNQTYPRYEEYCKNSVFNSFCINCRELADIDKYIIKTYYSSKLNKIINDHSQKKYTYGYKIISYILLVLFIALMLTLYFFGYFHRTFFSFIDNHFKVKWIAFNCKALFIFIFFAIWFTLMIIDQFYIYFNGFEYYVLNWHWFLLIEGYSLLFWITYFLILINCIYFIEKVCFPRLGQFAKQQIFSFITFVAAIELVTYLFDQFERYRPHDLNHLTGLYVGGGIALARFLYNYSNYQKKLAVIKKEQELTQLRELKIRAELNALQSKINPHFLYNALNSIAGLAHENADKVEQMALALSKLFRYSINKEDNDFTMVQNEVEMVSIYLDIEKVRFGDKLQYQVTLPKELEKERIPKFIIQPLVENAIKHGISQITSAGLLTLEISKSDTCLKIMVSDNGPDFPEDLMTGYGLQNIYEKLDILYPERYEVILQNGRNKNISVILKTEHEGTKTQ